MRGNGGKAGGCAGCPCESSLDQSILPSTTTPWQGNGAAVRTSNSLQASASSTWVHWLHATRLAYTVKALLRKPGENKAYEAGAKTDCSHDAGGSAVRFG